MLKNEYELILELVSKPETFNINNKMEELSLFWDGYSLADTLYLGTLFDNANTLADDKPKIYDVNRKEERVVDLHYLAERKFQTSETRGWAGIIDKYTQSWEEATQSFYEIINEYLVYYPVETMAEIQCATPQSNFADIYKRFKSRPALFVGNTDIERVRLFLDGYQLGWKELCGEGSFDWYREIKQYIAEKYDGTKNWTDNLLAACENETSTVELFFELLEESGVDISK